MIRRVSFAVRRLALAAATLALLSGAILPRAAGLHAQESAVATAKSAHAEKLAALLETREGEDFWATVARLEALGDEAVPALRGRLGDSSEKVRLGCASALLEMGDERSAEKALDVIEALCRGATDAELRRQALQIYGEHGDPEKSTVVLGEILDSDLDARTQVVVARALWEIDHVSRARERLVDLLGSKDAGTRQDAALALAEIGYFEGDVREVLRDLKSEPTARGRRAALLDRILRLSRQLDSKLDAGGVTAGTDVSKLLEIKEQRIRELEARLEGGGSGPGAATHAATAADRLLDEVIGIVQKSYVDPARTGREDLLLGAIQGLVHSLDEHSIFMTPDESKEFSQQLDGNYPGIGAQVSKKANGPLEVLRPIYGGPSHRKGILSRDLILEVDGVSTPELNMDEIMKLLKGPHGTTVSLKIWRRGWAEPKTIEVKRETIEVPSVYHEILPEGIGYLRLTHFGLKSQDEFLDGLVALEKAGMEGLIIDLRDNPGGRLPIAVGITDLFVRGKLPIVTQKGRPDAGDVVSHFPDDEARTAYPIVVIVNEQSASASEIVAGALQDFGRAVLVGRRTYGKGSVQNIIPVAGKAGAQLKLTVQYYFLPLDRCIHTIRDASGRVVQRGGVEPDVSVVQRTLASWQFEERVAVRDRPEIIEYVDRHFDALSALVPVGDRGDPSAYPELDKLIESLGTKLGAEDIQAVVRYETRRRIEDQRGRQLVIDLEEDRQLQTAVAETLRALGRLQSASASYAWIAPLAEAERGSDDDDRAGAKATDPAGDAAGEAPPGSAPAESKDGAERPRAEEPEPPGDSDP